MVFLLRQEQANGNDSAATRQGSLGSIKKGFRDLVPSYGLRNALFLQPKRCHSVFRQRLTGACVACLLPILAEVTLFLSVSLLPELDLQYIHPE